MTAENGRPVDGWPVPAGWTWSTMGEVAEVVGGGTPPTGDEANYGGEIPWITPADLSGYTHKTISRGARNITAKGLDNSGAKLMPEGTVLFSSRAPIGYVAIAANPVSTNQGFKSFILKPGLLPDYVFYYLHRANDLAIARASGTTFLEISSSRARTIPIPLAPPDEQTRIVAEVEKQFTRLDVAVKTLARVRAQLRRYRSSVLKAACEGRLVSTEAAVARATGRTFETGGQLLTRVLAQRPTAWQEWTESAGKRRAQYSQPRPPPREVSRLPEGWCWATWDQLGFSQNGRAFPSTDYSEQGVRLLRPGNLHVSGQVVWTEENTRHLPERYAKDFPDFLIGPGELIMNLTAQSLKDEFLGRICMTGPDEKERCLLNQRQARLKPILVSPRFVFWVFKSPLFRHFVNTLNTGSLIQHMFTSQLAEFALPLPPLAEQHRIVEELEARLSVVDAVEAKLVDSNARADSLRRGILAAAFEGTLVKASRSSEPAAPLTEE